MFYPIENSLHTIHEEGRDVIILEGRNGVYTAEVMTGGGRILTDEEKAALPDLADPKVDTALLIRTYVALGYVRRVLSEGEKVRYLVRAVTEYLDYLQDTGAI